MSLVGPLLPSLNVEEVPECERGGRWLWSDWSDEARGEEWGATGHHSLNRPPPHHFPVNISQETQGHTGTHWDTLWYTLTHFDTLWYTFYLIHFDKLWTLMLWDTLLTHIDTLGDTTVYQQYSQLMTTWLSSPLSDNFIRNSWLLTNNYALEPLKISNISSPIAYTSLPPVNPYYRITSVCPSFLYFFQSFWGREVIKKEWNIPIQGL